MSTEVKKLYCAQAFCAEFFADVIVDENRCSLILNVNTEYFSVIGNRLIAQGFYCCHITIFKTTITACFIMFTE